MRLHNTPPWLIGITRADIELDLRGIDAVAYVLYSNEPWAERIPIQIKSSWGGATHHKTAHPELAKAGIVYIVMFDDMDEYDIRRVLYSELSKRRARNIRFEKFLAKFVSSRLLPRAEKRRQNHYASEMKDLRFSQEASAVSGSPPLSPEMETGAEMSRSRLLRWLFPSRNDPDWKPWSWMIPSYW